MMPALEKKSGQKILIVDDDQNEMRSLVIGLRLEGFDAVGTTNGVTALAMLDESDFSAMIIDLMMPEMNGLQLARAVRATHPKVATMLMSAYHLSPVQLARADTGVVGFVPKPFSFEELVRFLHTKLNPNTQLELTQAPSATNSGLFTPIDVAAVARSRDSKAPLPEPHLPQGDSTVS